MIEAILSAMLSLVPPGLSSYSVVPLPECGGAVLRLADLPAGPEPAACSAPDVAWSSHHDALVRRETPEEGRARYETIARALDVVAAEAARAAPGERPLWPWDRRELVAGLLAVARHESGFRRDVHEGVGPAALGDCYRRPDGSRACRSVCLVQVQTGGLDGRRGAWTGRDLVGLDMDATTRCLRAGAELLARARWACARGGNWFAPSVALYGSGVSCGTRPAWVQRRAATYRRVLASLTAA
jgi:hypothetical protein